MSNRWSANTWVLVIVTAVLVMIGVDLGRRAIIGDRLDPQADLTKQTTDPPFKVGEATPDFSLPDASKKMHSLSELLRRAPDRHTILAFSCGCAACRTVQTYLGTLQKKLGPKAPQFICVGSTQPESEAAWVRDTGLKQTILYDKKEESTVIDAWKGHPCPRLFELSPDRRAVWIGPSPQGRPDTVQLMGYEVAQRLG
ncbi:MAG TPA: redoxin domain-containing protein, partial [Armatimonadota bacterium]|nr:redoxin domain-containing protein [Armatimonadota bacterium]